jgi:hypothetical protein
MRLSRIPTWNTIQWTLCGPSLFYWCDANKGKPKNMRLSNIHDTHVNVRYTYKDLLGSHRADFLLKDRKFLQSFNPLASRSTLFVIGAM